LQEPHTEGRFHFNFDALLLKKRIYETLSLSSCTASTGEVKV